MIRIYKWAKIGYIPFKKKNRLQKETQRKREKYDLRHRDTKTENWRRNRETREQTDKAKADTPQESDHFFFIIW